MYEDTVQPLTPFKSSVSVTAANLAAPLTPQYPTSPELSLTTPSVFSTEGGPVKQLPPQTIAALANQQSIMNNNASDAEKIAKGILPGIAGVTLAQVSSPGQVMKPGSGNFVKSLRQRAPGLPLDKLASPVTLNGNMGVNNISSLTKNTNVQLMAVSNSIQSATTQLTNNGTISSKDQPTQVSGIILAAQTAGVAAVTAALQNPQQVISNISGTANSIGEAISSGNFAAGLADKVASGVSGISTSLGGFANNALGALNNLSSVANNISGLASKGQSVMQNAFNIAETSFGNLKAGVANYLGGGTNPKSAASATLTIAQDLAAAKIDLAEAETSLVSARGTIDTTESMDAINELRKAEARVSAAAQKVEKLKTALAETAASSTPSAQSLQAAAMSAASGQLFAPTTSNTGANALPGGLGAFANVTGGLGANAAGLALEVAGSVSNGINSASKLVGNLVGNLQQTLTGSALDTVNKLKNSLFDGQSATTVSNELIGLSVADAKTSVSTLMSTLSSSLNSLGGEGQVKAATLATNTYAEVSAVMNSTLNATLDPKVPPPVFSDVVIDKSPNEQLVKQVSLQTAIDELKAEREALALVAAQATIDYFDDPTPSKLSILENVNTQISNIDIQLIAKQNQYEESLS